jgi:hypothetical protein
MESVKDTFSLSLASWQVRMANDFLPGKLKKLDKVIFQPGVIHCPNSYLIPEFGLSKRDWVLYLTDEQIGIVKKQFKLKTPIHGINITENLLKNKAVVFM